MNDVLNFSAVNYQNGWSVSVQVFVDQLLKRGFGHVRDIDWPVGDGATLDRTGLHQMQADQNDSSQAACISLQGGLAWLQIRDGQLRGAVAAPTAEHAALLIKGLRAQFPVSGAAGDPRRVPLWLWTLTQNGPRKIRRMIDVPTWPEIEDNYTASVQSQLVALMHGKPEAGRIVLWSGIPGTGKTFALRALASEWRSWCELHYVVDPEVLFGERPSYLIDLLFDEASGIPIEGSGTVSTDERWRLFVLEDTGEMLTVDAKEHVGQALSRLLNATDGLIGQGMRFLVLVSTNEEVGKLHPAVARPGRCAAQINFEKLSASEAEAWLRARGNVAASGAATIAELYGIVGGYTGGESKRTIGFRDRRAS